MSAVRVSQTWLALREPADAAARAAGLVDILADGLRSDRPIVIHDLACGSGSMLRWLGPRLPGPQSWTCYDLDPDLLAFAASSTESVRTIDGLPITVRVDERDISQLTSADHKGTALVTASAILDVLTGDELVQIIAACVQAAVPALFTLSVSGQVELWPPDPLDEAVARAFNGHQRRESGRGRFLGPRATNVAEQAFRSAGYQVSVRASPWQLGSAFRVLTDEWFAGWLEAACEQEPELESQTREYADRRRAAIAAGQLRVVVHHRDLLAQPR